MHKWDGPQSFPYVITIFSAPNYCGYYDNQAAVLIIKGDELSLKQYDETDPPYRLPNNMDIFSWSVPFLAQKVMNILLNIVQKVGDVDNEDNKNNMNSLINKELKGKSKNMFKAKINSLSKMNMMFGVLTSERENILKIKTATHDGKLPQGLLS